MDMRNLQARLKAVGRDPGLLDGLWGPKTRAALMAALQGDPARLTPADIAATAAALGLPAAKVGAVYDVESRGAGFDPATRRPIILFEPHIFHRETKGAFSTPGATVSYPVRGTRPYPSRQSDRYEQLMTAVGLSPGAAFASASWGLFQVMGFNAALAGFKTADGAPDTFGFALAMARSEREQLAAFGAFLTASGLLAKLKACTTDPETCRAFCAGYNGTGYAANAYHTKLAAAIKRRGG